MSGFCFVGVSTPIRKSLCGGGVPSTHGMAGPINKFCERVARPGCCAKAFVCAGSRCARLRASSRCARLRRRVRAALGQRKNFRKQLSLTADRLDTGADWRVLALSQAHHKKKKRSCKFFIFERFVTQREPKGGGWNKLRFFCAALACHAQGLQFCQPFRESREIFSNTIM